MFMVLSIQPGQESQKNYARFTTSQFTFTLIQCLETGMAYNISQVMGYHTYVLTTATELPISSMVLYSFH